MISGRPVIAEIGIPPPSAFAVVITSGSIPSCSTANQSPVRPNPVWISSATNTIPSREQNSRSVGR